MEGQTSPIIFGDWLQRRRKALGMTQDELAKRARCSLGALRKIESGDRKPSKQLAELLAEALEIPSEDQSIFVRAARGELALKRLSQHLPDLAIPLPDVASLQQIPSSAAPDTSINTLAPNHRLPLQAMPLIGREAELAAMERLFSEPQCRLLTLTGMGGIGKTSLAVEFGLRIQADFPGGVFYFPLTSVISPEKVVPAIADVLDFGFSGPGEPKEQLLNFLTGQIKQETLFIFDNLEHLLYQAASDNDKTSLVGLIYEILRTLPKVKILGTSRERLNIHGEWIYELHGLSVPPANFIGRMEEFESIALFLKSVQRIRLDFQASADEQESIVQIAQLVEGVPLAIELAAAWVGILSCGEIAREIKANMDFLTTSMRDIPERHRSIRATFDHSWKLLSDEECWVLSQLAVFHGGFDRIAAQQIAGAQLPALASLSAKSLVRRTETGRYDLHEVIRQYAFYHLNEDSRKNEPHTRHSEYYLALVRDTTNLLKSEVQQDTIRRLTAEIDNIRAAWFWAVEHNDQNRLAQAVRGFGWYFEITGLYREGIDQLELLVQALKSQQQDAFQCKLLGLTFIHQALLNFRRGVFDQARKLYEESIVLLRPVGDPALLADSLGFLGTILHLVGEYPQARELLHESLTFARQSGERWYEAWAVYNLGHIDGLLGHYTQGYEQMLAGLAIWRELGDPQSIALGLNFLIPTVNKLGRYAEARTFMYESIALCEQSKNHWGRGTAYRYLGLTCIAEGQYAEAQAHILKSLEIFGEFAVGWDIARSLAYLGDAAMLEGNLLEASIVYQDALQSSIKAQAFPIALDALAGLGELQARTGSPENALLASYFILSHSSSEGETKSRAERLRAAQESLLDSRQVLEVRAQAMGKTIEQIAKMVLEEA